MYDSQGLRITAIASLAVALGLAACDQRSDPSATRRADPTTATAPKPDAKDKVAAATDKMATAVDDSALTAKVKAALLAEPGLRSLEISVDTKNGAVTLTGNVDNANVRNRAKEVASGVEGVAMVVDRMTVKSS